MFNSPNGAAWSAGIKLIAFMVATGFSTALLIMVIGNVRFGERTEYRAIVDDALSLASGDDVRIAGVQVGRVDSIVITDDNRALVTFEVDEGVELTTQTVVTIRYRNLVGQRYIALSQENGSEGAVLAANALISEEQTRPALDLTTLFNGFQPLFKALSPEDSNRLAYEIVQVFQGEAGSVDRLLSNTATITQSLGDRSTLISDVIQNLTAVLETFNERDTELSNTITTLQQFVTGLRQDQTTITSSLDSISDLSVSTSNLLSNIRPDLTADITELNRLTSTLATDGNRREVDRILKQAPVNYGKLNASSRYGPFFNFYVCSMTVSGKLPNEFSGSTFRSTEPKLAADQARCRR